MATNMPLLPCGHSEPTQGMLSFFSKASMILIQYHSHISYYEPVVTVGTPMAAPWAFPFHPGCVTALRPFAIPLAKVTFHIVLHMPCGHQYAPWAYPHVMPHGHFLICPVGVPIPICHTGHCQQALKCFSFSEDLTCVCRVWAFSSNMYMASVCLATNMPHAFPILHPYSHRPCGQHRGPPFSAKPTLPWYALSAFPLQWLTILSLICVVIPYGFFLIATHMPRGHSLHVGIPTSAYAPWAPKMCEPPFALWGSELTTPGLRGLTDQCHLANWAGHPHGGFSTVAPTTNIYYSGFSHKIRCSLLEKPTLNRPVSRRAKAACHPIPAKCI